MSRRRVHSITSLARARSRRWDFDAQTLGGLQIDDQFEFRRQRDWQVGWLLALENPAGVDANLSIRIREAPTIAHQTAGRDELTQRINSGQCVARSHRNYSIALTGKERVAHDEQRLDPMFYKRRESRVEITFAASVHDK